MGDARCQADYVYIPTVFAPLHYVVLTKTAVIVELTYIVDVAYVNKLIFVFSRAVIFSCCFHSYYFNIYSRVRLALRGPLGNWVSSFIYIQISMKR